MCKAHPGDLTHFVNFTNTIGHSYVASAYSLCPSAPYIVGDLHDGS